MSIIPVDDGHAVEGQFADEDYDAANEAVRAIRDRLKASPKAKAAYDRTLAEGHLHQADLARLRKARALAQKAVGELMGMNQSEVSRLERRSDLLLSTLRKFVEATGGELVMVARYPDTDVEVLVGEELDAAADANEDSFASVAPSAPEPVAGPAVIPGWYVLQTAAVERIGAEATARYLFETGAVGDDAVSDGVVMIAAPLAYDRNIFEHRSLSPEAAHWSQHRMDVAGGEVKFLAGPSRFVTGLPLGEAKQLLEEWEGDLDGETVVVTIGLRRPRPNLSTRQGSSSENGDR